MLFFMYIGGGLAFILIVILLLIQRARLARSGKLTDNKMIAYVFLDIFIGIILICFVDFLVPRLIWTTSHKEVAETETVSETTKIYPLEDGAYINEVKTDKEAAYKLKVDNTNFPKYVTLPVKDVEVDTKKKETYPRYEKVDTYKIKRINKPGILYQSVNDIYANVYLQKVDAEYVSSKLRIHVPENSITKLNK